jgi:ribosome recycling factor
MYDFTHLKRLLKETQDFFAEELKTIRSGRANPSLLDGIKVESYGTKMGLSQVASITIEDATTLRVSPWDSSVVKAVESALRDADLGVSIGSDEKGVRVSFPLLTSERRAQLIKITKQKLEDARSRVRRNREEVWSSLQEKEKNKEISEDEKFRAKEKMENFVKETNVILEDMAKKKEVELSS